MSRITRRSALVALVGAGILAGCDRTPAGDPAAAPAGGELRPPVARSDTPRGLAPGDDDCPRDGLWRPCALVDRISRSGLGFRALGDTLRPAFFDVPGERYRIGRNATLTVFYFPDSIAANRAISRIDTVAMRAPGDSAALWGTSPILIRSSNLVAVLESDDAVQIERIQLSITAGAPYTAPSAR
jgi:hypothetical protein